MNKMNNTYIYIYIYKIATSLPTTFLKLESSENYMHSIFRVRFIKTLSFLLSLILKFPSSFLEYKSTKKQ